MKRLTLIFGLFSFVTISSIAQGKLKVLTDSDRGKSIQTLIGQIEPYSVNIYCDRYGNCSGKQIFFRGGFGSNKYDQGALIVIDGMRLDSSIENLSMVSSSDVVSIRVCIYPADCALYGATNYTGVIDIRTNRGSSKK